MIPSKLRLSYLLSKVAPESRDMKWGVQAVVPGVDLSAALDQQLGDLDAGKERVLPFLEQVLTLQRVVLHHRQVQEGVACR